MRELVHQVLHRLHLAPDGGRAFGENPLHFRRPVDALELPGNALRAERDRRERVLQLVRDAPRYLVPCRRALRVQQLARVLEHQHESRGHLVIQRRRGYRYLPQPLR